MSLNVVCIKWGTKYPPEYVNHLARAVRRHLTLPHRFVCLTDDPRGIDADVETKPLAEELPGWWNKLALFQPRVHDLEGTLLFIDLDMVVVGNLDGLALHPGRFLAVPTRRGDGEFSSALLRFEVGRHRQIWDLFVPRAEQVMGEVYGDQNWINACCIEKLAHEYTQRVRDLWPEVTTARDLIEALPRPWFPDFKTDLRDAPDHLSAEAKIIVFRGQPMVHEVGWVARLWRGEDKGARQGSDR
jgi:hypothetical protein